MNSSRTAVVLRLLGIGWYVAICISGGAVGGFWLDNRLESSPIFTLVGTLLGVALAVVVLRRLDQELFRRVTILIVIGAAAGAMVNNLLDCVEEAMENMDEQSAITSKIEEYSCELTGCVDPDKCSNVSCSGDSPTERLAAGSDYFENHTAPKCCKKSKVKTWNAAVSNFNTAIDAAGQNLSAKMLPQLAETLDSLNLLIFGFESAPLKLLNLKLSIEELEHNLKLASLETKLFHTEMDGFEGAVIKGLDALASFLS
ncbi:MAG: AtpZ/AtpI family protein, partial [Planctomycetes bacterium]|nr:AtpZ/AtpI family protein [Planctomycetota bacterium]